MSERLQIIIMAAFAVLCFGFGYLTAFIVTRNKWRDEMIERRIARYDGTPANGNGARRRHLRITKSNNVAPLPAALDCRSHAQLSHCSGRRRANSLRMFITRKSQDDSRRLDLYAQAEQHQFRHSERGRDHRNEHPYIRSDGPGGFVGKVFVASIHGLTFCTLPDDLALIQIH